MTPGHSRRAALVLALVVVAGVSIATQTFEHLGLLDRFETTGLDVINVLQPVRNPTEVVMVGITDDDYANYFGATSPLACEPVRRIIAAVAAGSPRVIGVDLDTGSGDFSCLRGSLPGFPPIVWAQDAVWSEERRAFDPLPILKNGGALRAGDTGALIAFPQDSDGVIRRFVPTLPTVSGARMDSLPWAVLTIACGRGCAACCRVREHAGDAEELRLNFAGERFAFAPLSVKNLFTIAESTGSTAFGTDGPFTNRIVLIGGNYRAARDSYVTPVGPMQGMQILAQAIESETHQGGIRPVNEWLAMLLEVLSGLLLVALHHALANRLGLATLISLGVIPVLTLVSSLLAFSTLARWFNFVPVVVAVLIHQLYDRAQEYRRLRGA